MNTAIDVGKTSFGTAKPQVDFATGMSGKGYLANCQQTSDRIQLLELEKALEMLGAKGKKSLMAYIQHCNPKIATDGYVELEMLREVLKDFFGDASGLLMQQICPQ